MDIHLKPISTVDFSAFTDAFNRAYSDYFVPIKMNTSSFKALMTRDDIRPDVSVTALDAGRIVGTGLLGVRGTQGWIGGMGVIPQYRGQGIGRQMMCYLLEQAKAQGITEVSLEVIEKNTPARSLYDSLGFSPVRYLLLAERSPHPIESDMPEYKIETRSPYELLDYYENFHRVPNCWQRGFPSLYALADQISGWAVVENERIRGYVLGTIDFLNIHLVDFATDNQPDQDVVALALLSKIHQRYHAAHSSTYNIAEDDPFWKAFEMLRYLVPMRQIQMRYQLG